MFGRDRFIADCCEAADQGQPAIRELMQQALQRPSDVIRELGMPERAGVNILYRSDRITVLNLIWGPHMSIMPHNHRMWAVIGIYSGREDNIFWRTLPPDARWQIEAAGARSLMPGDVCPLGPDIVHSVTNPIRKLTCAIHVYGGDFLAQEREEWDPETLCCRPYDLAKAHRMFEESNRWLELG